MPSILDKRHPSYNDSLEELLREVRRIRTIFDGADLNPKTVRRRLRKTLMGEDVGPVPKTVHRSPATKAIFSKASNLAEISGGIVYPAHLLLAVFLAEDERRDSLLQELGVNKRRLMQLTREEAGFRKAGQLRGTKHSFGN
jgi:ATP-dependent Clp protease ATP-binding subunit ClpA